MRPKGSLDHSWHSDLVIVFCSALSLEYKQPPSCFQANMECVNDEVCNKQLSLYLQVCQINGSSCDINRCQAALHAFYTNMPFQVAQMLTFCDCRQSDDNCHQARQFLHGHPCAIKMVPTPSCVHVMQLCRENKLCWYALLLACRSGLNMKIHKWVESIYLDDSVLSFQKQKYSRGILQRYRIS